MLRYETYLMLNIKAYKPTLIGQYALVKNESFTDKKKTYYKI